MAGPVDAILFDLDDTLVDWEGSIDRCVRDLGGDDAADRLLAWGREHTWIRRDGVVVHRNTWRLHELADECWPAALPHLAADELAIAIKRFRDELWVSFFADAVPTLDALVDDFKLGVVSNNPHTPSEVERLRLHDWFEIAIAVPREIAKPHRDAFSMGCSAIGVTPERAMFVGDSVIADVEGALAAGLVPVWIDRYDDGWQPPAGVHRIAALAELPALVAELP